MCVFCAYVFDEKFSFTFFTSSSRSLHPLHIHRCRKSTLNFRKPKQTLTQNRRLYYRESHLKISTHTRQLRKKHAAHHFSLQNLAINVLLLSPPILCSLFLCACICVVSRVFMSYFSYFVLLFAVPSLFSSSSSSF